VCCSVLQTALLVPGVGYATHCNIPQYSTTHCLNPPCLQHSATHCNTLYHNVAHCSVLQCVVRRLLVSCLSATHCNTPQRTATPRNTLQHTPTHCNKKPKTTRRTAQEHSHVYKSDLSKRFISHSDFLRLILGGGKT